jgi:hypothetical protein
MKNTSNIVDFASLPTTHPGWQAQFAVALPVLHDNVVKALMRTTLPAGCFTPLRVEYTRRAMPQ